MDEPDAGPICSEGAHVMMDDDEEAGEHCEDASDAEFDNSSTSDTSEDGTASIRESPIKPPMILDDDVEFINQDDVQVVARRICPCTVEGVAIDTELHINVQHYYRKMVSCPHHAKCRRKRNVSTRHTKHFGEMEVFGYMGVWLKAGACLTKEEHRDFKPQVLQVEQYLRSKGCVS
jgi:hypothetical protein